MCLEKVPTYIDVKEPPLHHVITLFIRLQVILPGQMDAICRK